MGPRHPTTDRKRSAAIERRVNPDSWRPNVLPQHYGRRSNPTAILPPHFLIRSTNGANGTIASEQLGHWSPPDRNQREAHRNTKKLRHHYPSKPMVRLKAPEIQVFVPAVQAVSSPAESARRDLGHFRRPLLNGNASLDQLAPPIEITKRPKMEAIRLPKE